ncbi:hypothetical protein [Devosia sp. SL43]|uniref:hypothetical protein n=1 Tax=Devosia sp. SL43 TaxID=2806348 RepID=UPI001F4376E9|nr:hypothetical protein [Devosia sp. SL43]UJW86333.1 hypothetical protein IM737_03400 [Devosia sp. SL43]
MSKTLLAPIAIVVAMALAACGGSAPADTAPAAEPAAPADTMAPAEPAAPAADPAAPAADPAAAPATTTP